MILPGENPCYKAKLVKSSVWYMFTCKSMLKLHRKGEKKGRLNMTKVLSTETGETTQERRKKNRLNMKKRKFWKISNKGEEIFMQRKPKTEEKK